MYRYNTSILPMGPTNIKTGKNKFFNVHETWGTDDTMKCEVWRKENGKHIIIFGSCSNQELEPITENSETFQHDQTGRYLFEAVKVDEFLLSELPRKFPNEVKSLHSYVYK